MVLSALRLTEQDQLPTRMECSDTDFEIAEAMIRILVKHSSRVFSEQPEETKPIPRKNLKERFLNELPWEFNRQTYLEVAQKPGIREKCAEKYIKFFVERLLCTVYNGILTRKINLRRKECKIVILRLGTVGYWGYWGYWGFLCQ